MQKYFVLKSYYHQNEKNKLLKMMLILFMFGEIKIDMSMQIIIHFFSLMCMTIQFIAIVISCLQQKSRDKNLEKVVKSRDTLCKKVGIVGLFQVQSTIIEFHTK